jgi:hypothetical protein
MIVHLREECRKPCHEPLWRKLVKPPPPCSLMFTHPLPQLPSASFLNSTSKEGRQQSRRFIFGSLFTLKFVNSKTTTCYSFPKSEISQTRSTMADAEMNSQSRRILAVALEGETAVLSRVIKGWSFLSKRTKTWRIGEVEDEWDGLRLFFSWSMMIRYSLAYNIH